VISFKGRRRSAGKGMAKGARARAAGW